MKNKKIIAIFSLALIVTFAFVFGTVYNVDSETTQDKIENASSILTHSGSSEQEVSLSIMQKPVVDIVLSKARSEVEVANFEADLMEELGKLNIDTSLVNVSAVETSVTSVDENGAAEIFNTWSKYPLASSSNFDAQWKLNGDEIYTTANVHWTGFWNSEASDIRNCKIQFDCMTTDHADPWGFTFRMTMPQYDRYSFYAVEWSPANQIFTLAKVTSWKPNVSDPTHGGPVYHGVISGADGYYSTSSAYYANGFGGALSDCSGKILERKSFPVAFNKWYATTIELEGNNIKVYIDGTLVINYTDNDNPLMNGGYGPYTASQYNTHYKNVCVVAESTKTLTEVLREPEWRNEAYKFVVDVDDYSNDVLQDEAQYCEILTRLLGDDIHFVSWGTAINQDEFEKLIQDNNTSGVFLQNTGASFDSLIQQTVQYIREVIGDPEESNYVIVGDPLDITITPEEFATGTADEDWPYGKWKVDHEYTYFENNMGQYADSGRYVNDFVNVFDKVGRYVITYRDLPIVPTEVFVHRRPVAQIGLSISGNNVTLTSESYDLDMYSSENKGIAEEDWQWKTVDEASWHSGKLPTTVDPSTSYLVQLRVKDNQGAWSTTASKYVSLSSNSVPVALFSVETSPITTYMDDIVIKDSSYDPAGKTLTNYAWEVHKAGQTGAVYTGNTPIRNFKTLGTGTYTIYLTVTNSAGSVSERYAQTVVVVDDTIPPEFIATPLSIDWVNGNRNVRFSFSDEGGSGFKGYQYAITNSQSVPASYSSFIECGGIANILVTETGENYIHIIAKDNAGNVSADRVVGPYKIDKVLSEGSATITQPTAEVRAAVINFTATDEHSGVKNIKLPDDSIVNADEATYNVTWPGVYTFTIYDVAGNETEVDVNVTIVSGGAVAKYVDKFNTNIEIASRVVRTGNVGDNYSTDAKDVTGYQLVTTPSNKDGILQIDKQEIIYEYKKITSVTAQYIDELHPTDMLSQEVINGLQGDHYETIEKDISGFVLTGTEGELEGNMSAEPIVVKYKYKKLSNLITKHIDANTNAPIVADVVVPYKEADNYESYSLDLEGYALVESPAEESGVMGRSDVTKTYYYKKISNGLVVKYIDKVTGTILDQKIYEGNEMDVITLEEKTINGYDLIERPTENTVTLTVEAQERKFYYRKNLEFNVMGIDQETGEELYRYQLTGLEGLEYSTEPRDLDGYRLVKTAENKSGKYDRNGRDIVYEYRRISNGVTIRYVDVKTGEELYNYRITGLSGYKYQTKKKDFEDYEFINVVGEEKGELLSEDINVTYYYTRNTGKVIVIYQDINGVEIYREVMEGVPGTDYTIEEREITNYRVKEYPESMSGVYREEDITLVFTMEKIPAKVTVMYVDILTGQKIKKNMVLEGFVGDGYTITPKNIKGYELDSHEGNLSGVFTEDEITITFYYNLSDVKGEEKPDDPTDPVKPPVIPDDPEVPVEPVVPTEPEQPNTGDIAVTMLLMVFIISSTVFAKRFKYVKTN